jgi:hypothetical protein
MTATSAELRRWKRFLARAGRWSAFILLVAMGKAGLDAGYSNLFVGAQPAYPDGTTTFDVVALVMSCALALGCLAGALFLPRAEARAEAFEQPSNSRTDD